MSDPDRYKQKLEALREKFIQQLSDRLEDDECPPKLFEVACRFLDSADFCIVEKPKSNDEAREWLAALPTYTGDEAED